MNLLLPNISISYQFIRSNQILINGSGVFISILRRNGVCNHSFSTDMFMCTRPLCLRLIIKLEIGEYTPHSFGRSLHFLRQKQTTKKAKPTKNIYIIYSFSLVGVLYICVKTDAFVSCSEKLSTKCVAIFFFSFLIIKVLCPIALSLPFTAPQLGVFICNK